MAGLLPALRRGIVAGREVVTLRNAHMAVSVVPGGEAGGRADPHTGCPVVLLSRVCLFARPTVRVWLVCVRGRGLSVCACACAGVVCLRPVCSHPCVPVSAAGRIVGAKPVVAGVGCRLVCVLFARIPVHPPCRPPAHPLIGGHIVGAKPVVAGEVVDEVCVYCRACLWEGVRPWQCIPSRLSRSAHACVFARARVCVCPLAHAHALSPLPGGPAVAAALGHLRPRACPRVVDRGGTAHPGVAGAGLHHGPQPVLRCVRGALRGRGEGGGGGGGVGWGWGWEWRWGVVCVRVCAYVCM
jgi:hypothetical protein